MGLMVLPISDGLLMVAFLLLVFGGRFYRTVLPLAAATVGILLIIVIVAVM